MNRCSKRSFGMKLIGLMTAAIMLFACCMPAFAAESETRTNTESFQLLTYSEDSASMGSGWTWEITLRIRSISLSATECMVFNPMETVIPALRIRFAQTTSVYTTMRILRSVTTSMQAGETQIIPAANSLQSFGISVKSTPVMS